MRALAFFILIVPLIISCQQRSEEISQWRGPNRDGFYPDKNLLKEWPAEGPELLWTYKGLGNGYSTVAVTRDKIFTSGMFDSLSYLIALDHEGKLIWKKEYSQSWTTNFPGTRSTPMIYKGFGYVLSSIGKLVCFDPETGDFIWTKDLYNEYLAREVRFGMTENLLIDDGKLYCTPGGVQANVVALNPKTGELIWKSRGNGEPSAYCSPSVVEINGKKVFITLTANSVICLNPDNGDLLWSHDLNYPHGIHGNTPVYHEGYIFAMNGWGYGSVMLKINADVSGVIEVWRSNLFDLEHGDVIRIGDNIYGTDYTTRYFSCVDWETGIVIDSINKLSPGTVISADGMIYCYSYSGDVSLIKPKQDGFDIVSTFSLPGFKRDHIAHPVIYDGKLYLRYNDELMVYSISENKNI